MSKSGLKVAVVGATGLAGGELLRLLLQHPAVGKVVPFSRTQSGTLAMDVHPVLKHLAPIAFSTDTLTETVEGMDVVFFALPHCKSSAMMAEITESTSAKIIDLAADYRLLDKAVYEKYYSSHPSFELVSTFVYGLPEAFKEKIQQADRIANPGCFATASELLLLPPAKAGLLGDEPCPVFAVTGSTGSGKNPKPTTHHPFRDGNFFAYKALAHQHQPEIEQTLSTASNKNCNVRLLSHSGPFVRGIHASTFLGSSKIGQVDVRKLYEETYANEPFVYVYDSPPKLAEVAGTNYVHIHVAQQGDEVEITLALDNLVKGAAGQAVQNMNLMMGIDETAGLTSPGAYPC